MNNSDITILSDRGPAILNALNRHCNKAFLKPCPLHIKRNLIHHGYSTKKLLSLYWEATNAPTFSQYENIMREMRTAGNGKGEKMAQYLEEIDNWQLYKAVERGNRIYEMKSDNIVEITFSWLEEVRSYCTPYYVIADLMMENIIRINNLYKECVRTNQYGLTKWLYYFMILIEYII